MINNNEANKAIKKLMKKDFNKLGIALILKELLLYGIIIALGIGVAVIEIIKNSNISDEQIDNIFNKPSFQGTSSILVVLIAFIPILVYRGKKFFQYDLKVVNRKFTLKIVTISFIILFAANNLLGLFTDGLEWGLNTIGFSANSALDILKDINQPVISMIIYSCIVGPIVEECIYRGAVLRSLEKYGRRFAILASGILFGLMHGNFYQVFMAIIIGIILGYLATEYSIKLTILLHMLNNTCVQVLSDINSHVSENTVNIISIIVIVISTIILIMAFVYYKDYIKEWLENNKIEKRVMVRFFTSFTIILVILLDLLIVVSDIVKL
ncbi:CPBP family intramembrane glutamic endopeptidase [Clostridium beijerinckii]|uniref:CPBP family intramembrane glutamic endopeptidase n=1 Tax=Clostridium beijerinckii TaxID=1520 RepID=UPI0009D1B519|nr:type II CAAX endopeptidase family protein [Clostridium beijerinckii]MBA8933784.1 hypothetical protein [Clostridium beijerinckii]NRT36302.1 hypothetical protein [Clostridium beijerinckii]NRT44270.1 hypothetical protein [Clostridium beijerinckii]NRU37980.1 hypothetical protein [Clostridium beijerinckii]NRZ21737.1 hypothetical protein [Clostridium beijerinckii]